MAYELGKTFGELDELLGLEPGTCEFLEEYDVVPEGEILRRFLLVLGIDTNEEDELSFNVERRIFVLKDAEFVRDYIPLEQALSQMHISVEPGDGYEYLGFRVNGEDMSRAHIHEGDTVVLRRQMSAADGDIVLASVEGETVLRRFRRKLDTIWLEAEGEVSRGEPYYSENVTSRNRKIKIIGRVMSVVRDFK